jgi:hypothetical protein
VIGGLASGSRARVSRRARESAGSVPWSAASPQRTPWSRAQLKWLMAGSMATVLGLAGTFLLQSFTGLLGAR